MLFCISLPTELRRAANQRRHAQVDLGFKAVSSQVMKSKYTIGLWFDNDELVALRIYPFNVWIAISEAKTN